jgi:hypothetical protein
LENANHSENGYEAGGGSDMGPHNDTEDPQSVQQDNVTADQNIPRSIRPKWMSLTKAEMGLLRCNSMEMMRNRGIKYSSNRMCHQIS